ncbi:AlpA family phage regulatory protein [Janthinobacterium lividum]|nr:AlpA family phage regulatory protein [Janthinobacterium lividum]
MTETTSSLPPPLSILRRRQVEARIALSRSCIYDKLSPKSPRFDPSFPRPVQLGPNAVGWIESEIEAWLHTRLQVSRSATFC